MNCLDSPIWPETVNVTAECCCEVEATASFQNREILISASQFGFDPFNSDPDYVGRTYLTLTKTVNNTFSGGAASYSHEQTYDEFGIVFHTGSYSYHHVGGGSVTVESGSCDELGCWSVSWSYTTPGEGGGDPEVIAGSGYFSSIEAAKLAGALLHGVTECGGSYTTGPTSRTKASTGCTQSETLSDEQVWAADASSNTYLSARRTVAALSSVPWGCSRGAEVIYVPPVNPCGLTTEERDLILAAYDEAVADAETALTAAEGELATANTAKSAADADLTGALSDFGAAKASWASERVAWCVASRAKEAACRKADYVASSGAVAACATATTALATAAGSLATAAAVLSSARTALLEAYEAQHVAAELAVAKGLLVDYHEALVDLATDQQGAANGAGPSLQKSFLSAGGPPFATITPHYAEDYTGLRSLTESRCTYRVKVVAGPFPDQRVVQAQWDEIALDATGEGSNSSSAFRSVALTFGVHERVKYTGTRSLTPADTATGYTAGSLGGVGGGAVSPALAASGGRLHKKGFAAYTGAVGAVPVIYRKEVATGGYAGCVAAGLPAKTYSGQHGYDAAGVALTDTLSADTKAFNPPRISKAIAGPLVMPALDWTSVDSATVKKWILPDPCGVGGNDSLTLTLSEPWTTGELEDAVDDLLQADLDEWPVGGFGDAAAVTWTSPDEVTCERRQIRPQFPVSRTWQPIDEAASVTWSYRVTVVNLLTGALSSSTVTGGATIAIGETVDLALGTVIAADEGELVYLSDFLDTTAADPDEDGYDHSIRTTYPSAA